MRLVRSRSDDEFAEALESVLASPPSPEDRERAQKLVVERFSIQRLADDIERVYEDALERAGVQVPWFDV